MDEPTASLDPAVEAELFNTINMENKNMISIIVSHCLAGANAANAVIYLNNGNLMGFGKHKVLMETIEEYKEFYNLQRNHYV